MNTRALSARRTFKKFSLIICFLLLFLQTHAQTKPELKFDKNGKFKIVQFTDVHLKVENKPRCDSVMNTISSLVESEKPDLVVFTGDIVTSEFVEKAWLRVTAPISNAGIPWAVVFGNHDH